MPLAQLAVAKIFVTRMLTRVHLVGANFCTCGKLIEISQYNILQQNTIICHMRPSSLGGGPILRRTLSVCLSVRPSRYRASRRAT